MSLSCCDVLSIYIRDNYTALVGALIERVLVHSVNHRVQDFQDPLTSTLVLMATSPMQMVMCEAGLLPFKTNLLPVLPYALLTPAERANVEEMLAHVPDDQLHETIESSGQYTLTVLPYTQNTGSSPTITLLCKKQLLHAFVNVMLSAHDLTQVGRTLCNIVLQRFLAQVPTPSEIVSSVMDVLQPSSKARPTNVPKRQEKKPKIDEDVVIIIAKEEPAKKAPKKVAPKKKFLPAIYQSNPL
jgi:hypothetical protein